MVKNREWQTKFSNSQNSDVAQILSVDDMEIVKPTGNYSQINNDQNGGNAGIVLVINNFDKGFELIEN